jgi:hypothetical protein
MVRGYRPLPARLVSLAVRKLHLAPTALPMLPPLATQFAPVAPDELASALARLGSRDSDTKQARGGIQPAFLVAGTLVHLDLEVRIVEALPWILSKFHDLDWIWLIAQCRLLNVQNQLGYLIVLARQLGNSTADVNLKSALFNLEESRLVVEGTFMPRVNAYRGTGRHDWCRSCVQYRTSVLPRIGASPNWEFP